MSNLKNPCETPGLKIRSKGAGRGLARGQGRGPLGKPALANNPLRGFRGFINPARQNRR